MHLRALKDIVAPLSSPLRGVDGQLMKEVVIPKGTLIFLGVRASNCNTALWGEDAMEWKPERWAEPLPSSVTDARIPGVFGSLSVQEPRNHLHHCTDFLPPQSNIWWWR